MSCALSLSEFVEKVCEKRKKGKRTKNKKKKTNPGANPGVLNAKGGILDTAASNSSLIHMLAFHLVPSSVAEARPGDWLSIVFAQAFFCRSKSSFPDMAMI